MLSIQHLLHLELKKGEDLYDSCWLNNRLLFGYRKLAFPFEKTT